MQKLINQINATTTHPEVFHHETVTNLTEIWESPHNGTFAICETSSSFTQGRKGVTIKMRPSWFKLALMG